MAEMEIGTPDSKRPEGSQGIDLLSIAALRGAKNPLTLEQTLEKLRHYLSATRRLDGLELLEQAVNKAKVNKQYHSRLREALLRGSTIECRELFSDFGDYWKRTSITFPYYPHHDAVNSIDTAMFHIKIGYEQQAIDDFNFLHNAPLPLPDQGAH